MYLADINLIYGNIILFAHNSSKKHGGIIELVLFYYSVVFIMLLFV